MMNFLRQSGGGFVRMQNSLFSFTTTRSMGHERFTEFIRESRYHNAAGQATVVSNRIRRLAQKEMGTFRGNKPRYIKPNKLRSMMEEKAELEVTKRMGVGLLKSFKNRMLRMK